MGFRDVEWGTRVGVIGLGGGVDGWEGVGGGHGWGLWGGWVWDRGAPAAGELRVTESAEGNPEPSPGALGSTRTNSLHKPVGYDFVCLVFS